MRPVCRERSSPVTADYDNGFDCLSDNLVVNEPPVLPYGDTYRGHDGFRKVVEITVYFHEPRTLLGKPKL